MQLVVATRNKKKLLEIKSIIGDVPLTITSLANYSDVPSIEEDGVTFEENATKKALTIARFMGPHVCVLGEDSGLEVAALENRPGVHSARYAGADATDKTNNRKLLQELKGIPFEKRQARYVCCAALACGERAVGVVRGECEGFIALEPRGSAGFGYDPLFYIPQYHKTFGELGEEIKRTMSHRSRALEKVRALIAAFQKSNP